jgi:DNA polymerase III subunit alpha
MPVKFIHLRNHSAYSLAEGAITIKQLAKLAHAARMPAVAITDTGNLFGALEFSEAMKEKGVQPIVGCALRVDMAMLGRDPLRPQTQIAAHPSLVLLAKDTTGYGNLMKLVSKSFIGSPDHQDPHVTLQQLRDHADGVICLSGGPSGHLNKAICENQIDGARNDASRLKELFGDRFYIELQRHGVEAEKIAEPVLLDIAYTQSIPIVATNETYFATIADHAAHDALICIAAGEVVNAENRRRVSTEHWFKSQDDMAKLFADLPEAIENTIEIAKRCAFMVEGRKPILPRFAEGDEAEELRNQARLGLKARIVKNGYAEGYTEQDYLDRLEFELSVIINMQYPGYFLIVADFIKWAKSQSIPVGPGRGSGAGSLVAYSLTITDLDPLRFQLLFERFLNPDRVSMPDFDIDFCQDRRDEVIRYVQQRYGTEKVAQIITFGKLQARMVTRDVGRVLQIPYGQVDRLSKLIPMNPANPVTLQQAIDSEPRLQEERDRDPMVNQLFSIALKLEGLYRNASTHAAGVVIGDRPLDELVPLYRDPRSPIPATQFNMKYVEKAGLVKFDFLGLKTLTVIDKAQRLIRKCVPDFEANAIPLDDEKTFKMLAKGDTMGVFQLESGGMRDAVRQMQADRFEDLIALVALFRPGPMANIPSYCARKLGKEPVTYLHPMLESVLKNTFGIITYQEQVQQTAKDMAGYTLAEADLLRRAMGKKIKSEMDAQRERFVNGAVERGVKRDTAHEVFDACAKFAEYGFNKSHSAPYAYISYQTAFMKANYPVEFLAASMTLDTGNTDKLMLFAREAEKLGIKLRPPSVNESELEFAVQDGEIIYALSALKNVGAGAIEQIVAQRAENGRFTSIHDVATRLDSKTMNRRALESLVKAGAFDGLNPNRAQILDGVDMIMAAASNTSENLAAGNMELFGSDPSINKLTLPHRDAWLPMEKLNREFEAVGFYLSGHPLDDYLKPLERLNVESWASFRSKVLNRGATAAKIAGTVIYRQERRSRQGNKFAFLGFSDPTGQYEAVCFADTLAQSRELLEPGKSLLLRVEAEADGEEVKLRIQGVEDLEIAARSLVKGMKVYLRDEKTFNSVLARLTNSGRAPVRIVVMTEEGSDITVQIGDKFTVSPQIMAAVKAISGVVAVEEI